MRKELKVVELEEADSIRRKQLRDELIAQRATLKASRTARIQQLDEAIGIARRLKLIYPATRSTLSNHSGNGGKETARAEINNDQLPLYFMGVEALVAERESLKARRSDDFTSVRIAEVNKELMLLEQNREVEALGLRQDEDVYLDNAQDLQVELSRLRHLKLDLSDLKLVRVDRHATQAVSPLRPRKALLVAFGLLSGLMIGLAIAIFRKPFVYRKAQTAHLPSVRESGPSRA